MDKIFIIWHDYDGTYVEEFETEGQETEKAEERCANVLAREGLHDSGTSMDIIIKGRELKMETVEVVSKVLLK